LEGGVASNEIEARKSLTFAQAEGAEPLPSQLRRAAMPRVLRARLFSIFHRRISGAVSRDTGRLLHPWREIIPDIYTDKYGVFPNKIPKSGSQTISMIELIFEKPDYLKIYGFIQHVLRHPECPTALAAEINTILTEERAAYRIVDENTLIPVGSDEEIAAVASALYHTGANGLDGARAHLKNAGAALSTGQFADSVRDSIHAVEAVARSLEPSAELSTALAKIEKSSNIHGAMKKAFLALYGYSSDEGGIRHPLLDKGDANVDEADALFMIGACASFVTYLIEKKKLAGLVA
jgi:hypothetical protein